MDAPPESGGVDQRSLRSRASQCGGCAWLCARQDCLGDAWGQGRSLRQDRGWPSTAHHQQGGSGAWGTRCTSCPSGHGRRAGTRPRARLPRAQMTTGTPSRQSRGITEPRVTGSWFLWIPKELRLLGHAPRGGAADSMGTYTPPCRCPSRNAADAGARWAEGRVSEDSQGSAGRRRPPPPPRVSPPRHRVDERVTAVTVTEELEHRPGCGAPPLHQAAAWASWSTSGPHRPHEARHPVLEEGAEAQRG